MAEPKDRAAIVITALLSLTTFSLGFGASQMTLSKDVHVATADIASLKRDLETERTRTDQRISLIVSLVEKEVQQSTELITLIRVQQQTK